MSTKTRTVNAMQAPATKQKVMELYSFLSWGRYSPQEKLTQYYQQTVSPSITALQAALKDMKSDDGKLVEVRFLQNNIDRMERHIFSILDKKKFLDSREVPILELFNLAQLVKAIDEFLNTPILQTNEIADDLLARITQQ